MNSLMNENQRRVARHMLGLPNRHRRSYRNSFVASEGHADYAVLDSMRMAGFVKQYGTSVWMLTGAGAVAALLPGERLCSEDFKVKGAA